MLITECEIIKPLLCVDWLRELKWTIRNIENTMTIINRSENYKIITNFKLLSKKNRTVQGTEIKLELKPGHPPMKRKLDPNCIFYKAMSKKSNLIQSGHLEKVQKVKSECFVSLVVNTVKKDNLVKIALDSRKLNDNCKK